MFELNSDAVNRWRWPNSGHGPGRFRKPGGAGIGGPSGKRSRGKRPQGAEVRDRRFAGQTVRTRQRQEQPAARQGSAVRPQAAGGGEGGSGWWMGPNHRLSFPYGKQIGQGLAVRRANCRWKARAGVDGRRGRGRRFVKASGSGEVRAGAASRRAGSGGSSGKRPHEARAGADGGWGRDWRFADREQPVGGEGRSSRQTGRDGRFSES